MMKNISCMLVDVIKTTLASCDYHNCTEICTDYLMHVSNECPVVFHNETYLLLWNTLFNICFNNETIELDGVILGGH